MTTYLIGQLAERSGFSTATLRYYENEGLLASARTPTGYRVYDETAISRLEFIARAKQLGCSLEEIAALLSVWDGGECRPVQDQLRAIALANVARAKAKIAELTELIAELERAVAVFGTHRPAGACDEWCGCRSDRNVANGKLSLAQPVALSRRTVAVAGTRPRLDQALAGGEVDG